MLKMSSKQNDIILDVFGGSGSTLIACEQLNRKCFMCEVSEHYCDVIITRWENFTGEKAVKVN
jgi:DNA modification methylase